MWPDCSTEVSWYWRGKEGDKHAEALYKASRISAFSYHSFLNHWARYDVANWVPTYLTADSEIFKGVT